MFVIAGRILGPPRTERLSGSRQAYESEPLAIPVTVHGGDKLRSKKGRT